MHYPIQEKMDSSKFDWHEVQHEHFNYNKKSFDVNKAKKIINKNPRPLYWIPVEDLKKDAKTTSIDRTLDKKVDLSIPIIMITLENGEMLCIDGYHRIRKAIKNNIKKITYVLLDTKETQSIRME